MPFAALKHFYDVTTPRLADIMAYLDGNGYGGVRADLDGYGWRDAKLDLFWASYEVLKPAVYARPPQPVVAPLFKYNRRLQYVTAEMLERFSVSVFKRTDIFVAISPFLVVVIFSVRCSLLLLYFFFFFFLFVF